MIIRFNHGYESISNQSELDEYYSLQENVGLRYVKAHSLNYFESVRICIPHKTEKYIILVPYDKILTTKSFSFSTPVNKGQTVRAMTQYGMLRETGLRMKEMNIVGTPIQPEIRGERESGKIFIVVVTEYYKNLFYEPLYYSHKYGPPVWVQEGLLSSIFETVKINNEEDRFQLETYRRTKEWLSRHLK